MIERLYPGTEEWGAWHPEHIARYFYALQFTEGARILDAGTGCGYGAAILRLGKALSVDAVDIDPPTVEQATQRFGQLGIAFRVDDCECLSSVKGPFDLICSFENIEHLVHPEHFLRTAVSLLGPKGVLLCSTPCRETSAPFSQGRPANKYHIREWYRDEFQAMLSERFSLVDMRVQVATLSFRRREAALKALNRRLSYLRWAPMVFVLRLLKRLRVGAFEWPDISALIGPTVEDFPIYPSGYASMLGTPMTHYAVCRCPRK